MRTASEQLPPEPHCQQLILDRKTLDSFEKVLVCGDNWTLRFCWLVKSVSLSGSSGFLVRQNPALKDQISI